MAPRSTCPASSCPEPATASSTAAWKMSVPTIFAAVSGKAISITSPNSVPLPTDVRPTTNPPTTPVAKAIMRSRFVSRNGLSSGIECRYALTRKAIPQTTSATPRIVFAVSSYPSPYSFLSHHETATPMSENGADPSSIHAVSRACTWPMRRCWAAPNDLKIAP